MRADLSSVPSLKFTNPMPHMTSWGDTEWGKDEKPGLPSSWTQPRELQVLSGGATSTLVHAVTNFCKGPDNEHIRLCSLRRQVSSEKGTQIGGAQLNKSYCLLEHLGELGLSELKLGVGQGKKRLSREHWRENTPWTGMRWAQVVNWWKEPDPRVSEMSRKGLPATYSLFHGSVTDWFFWVLSVLYHLSGQRDLPPKLGYST